MAKAKHIVQKDRYLLAITDPRTEERLRQGFRKYLNPIMLAMWRLGLGDWFKVCPEISGNVLVLTHIGRKTGIKRYQPLNFTIVDDDIYCVAAFGDISDWYLNISANPNVEVWLPSGWWAGVAEDISDSPSRNTLICKQVHGSRDDEGPARVGESSRLSFGSY